MTMWAWMGFVVVMAVIVIVGVGACMRSSQISREEECACYWDGATLHIDPRCIKDKDHLVHNIPMRSSLK